MIERVCIRILRCNSNPEKVFKNISEIWLSLGSIECRDSAKFMFEDMCASLHVCSMVGGLLDYSTVQQIQIYSAVISVCTSGNAI